MSFSSAYASPQASIPSGKPEQSAPVKCWGPAYRFPNFLIFIFRLYMLTLEIYCIFLIILGTLSPDLLPGLCHWTPLLRDFRTPDPLFYIQNESAPMMLTLVENASCARPLHFLPHRPNTKCWMFGYIQKRADCAFMPEFTEHRS